MQKEEKMNFARVGFCHLTPILTLVLTLSLECQKSHANLNCNDCTALSTESWHLAAFTDGHVSWWIHWQRYLSAGRSSMGAVMQWRSECHGFHWVLAGFSLGLKCSLNEFFSVNNSFPVWQKGVRRVFLGHLTSIAPINWVSLVHFHWFIRCQMPSDTQNENPQIHPIALTEVLTSNCMSIWMSIGMSNDVTNHVSDVVQWPVIRSAMSCHFDVIFTFHNWGEFWLAFFRVIIIEHCACNSILDSSVFTLFH